MSDSATATGGGFSATSMLAYCRAGFEGECGRELARACGALGLEGHLRSRPDRAFAEYVFGKPVDAARTASRLRFDRLVFARQLVFVARWIDDLAAGDRVAALLAAVRSTHSRFGAVHLETADTNEAKALAPFLRAFQRPFVSALESAAVLHVAEPALPRLHVFFRGSMHAAIAVSFPGNSSPWPMGIPRIALPRNAPSRSALKLAEALQLWHDREALGALLHDGVAAVDLGAAPGGWTSQLVARGVHVTAVDNGALDPRLVASGLVDHVRADGFRYRPLAPVAWMVCDIVEQPTRVAALVGTWLANRWCERTIFNLKLPMKKRIEALDECAAIVRDRCAEGGVGCTLLFRQLYHDREEVTGYAVREAQGRAARGAHHAASAGRKAPHPRTDQRPIATRRRRS